MIYSDLYKILIAGSFLPFFGAKGAVITKKPNVIVIVTDDQGYGDLGVYGGKDLKTPNLDRLCNSGVRFTNWYANCSVSSPTRASIMTGMYPRAAGVPDLLGPRSAGLYPDIETIAEAFKTMDYKTALIGKWHLGGAVDYRPNKFGFDYFFGFLEGCIDYFSHTYFLPRANRSFHDLWRNEEPAWEDGEYLTSLITRESMTFINQNKNQPFYLHIAFNAPHYPLQVPHKYKEQFSGLDPQRQAIAALLKAVDDGIGEIIGLLKDNGLLENTIIFYESDNGPSNEKRNFYYEFEQDRFEGSSSGGLKGNKGSLFEGGIRVPAAICWEKHIPSGKVIDQIGCSMDILPTVLSLAGAEKSKFENVDGKDLTRMILNGEPSPHDYLCFEYLKQRAIRKGDWKLIVNGKLDFNRTAKDTLILVNLHDDPGESKNLSGTTHNKVKELLSNLNNWEMRTKNPYKK